ncbi:MAG: RNA polymerase subunit sigma-70 [Planctomycetes bacterium]|nr:RNA polymerase subunit sigma-70 [Planctomycetota bacterium]
MNPPIEPPSPERVTQILKQAGKGDQEALRQIFPLVYGELRRLAGRYLAGESEGHTLQPTALVHEAYLRLLKRDEFHAEDTAQFLGIAAQAMRRILVDHARTRGRAKRGGHAARVILDDTAELFESSAIDLLALEDALDELARVDERKVRLVELRFYAGLGIKEVAAALGIAPRTAELDWTMARAFLRSHTEGST